MRFVVSILCEGLLIWSTAVSLRQIVQVPFKIEPVALTEQVIWHNYRKYNKSTKHYCATEIRNEN
jgi:hypothetical protein